jgi:sterol desaturase/sphingolipid hydroxylase (fatty acid hydroxylase superfamily)
MIRALLLTALSFATLSVVFGALERAFPARKGQPYLRPAFVTDATFFAGQYLAFAGLTTSLLAAVDHALASAGLSLATWSGSWPLLLRVAIAMMAGDFLVYWFHRACHRFDLLWRFHAVHHSVEHLDWLAAHREHPLDGMATQLCLNLPGIVLGLPFEALGALIVLRGMWAIFVHSNVRLPLGPLLYLLGAPELHHFHHARAERTAHNFANVAPWLDLLFGTFHRPRGEETYPLGLSEPWPRGYFAQLLEPLRPRRRLAPGKLEHADELADPA